MREELSTFELARESIIQLLNGERTARISDVLRKIEGQTPTLSSPAVRGALWTMVNRGDLEVLANGQLQIRR